MGGLIMGCFINSISLLVLFCVALVPFNTAYAGSILGVEWGENDEIEVVHLDPETGEQALFASIQPSPATDDWWVSTSLDNSGRRYYLLANFDSSTQPDSSALYIFDLDDPDPQKIPLNAANNLEFAADGLTYDPANNILLTTYPADAAGDEIRVVSIDPATGEQNLFATLPLPAGYDTGYAQTALNSAGRLYYLLANFKSAAQTSPNTASLYIYNLDSGALTNTLPDMEYGSYDLTYDPVKNSLLTPNFERNDITVLRINPDTGVHTIFKTIPAAPGASDWSAATAMDSLCRRYFILAENEFSMGFVNYTLFVYDLDSGDYLSNATLSDGPGDLVFDNGPGIPFPGDFDGDFDEDGDDLAAYAKDVDGLAPEKFAKNFGQLYCQIKVNDPFPLPFINSAEY